MITIICVYYDYMGWVFILELLSNSLGNSQEIPVFHFFFFAFFFFFSILYECHIIHNFCLSIIVPIYGKFLFTISKENYIYIGGCVLCITSHFSHFIDKNWFFFRFIVWCLEFRSFFSSFYFFKYMPFEIIFSFIFIYT